MAEGDSVVFALRLPTSEADKYLEYVYTVSYDNYMMDFDIRTVGLKDVIANNADYMSIDWEVVGTEHFIVFAQDVADRHHTLVA